MQNPRMDIVDGFISRTLDKSLWTHDAHQITAIWFLMHYEPDDALCRIKSGIIAYNLAVGGENTGQNGYHETITILWWSLIHLFVERHREFSYEDLCDAFLSSPYSARDIGFKFYTKERLLSSEARSRYLTPDIQEITL
ncbi:MAG: hypothetical protein KA109_11615 [Saprospiraceae bacterium]|jgi:hypothetical protein|nr:hypothetical protein [Saprospiraceae bacterium]MBK6481120.1 hypothetical protein [Saprospiraceae bacterium]MBK6815477.1 hypothetical protein [Saprospiraceae bacterium]MBK7372508.1 hypothetical protein [Saprospiraceae bacterium]MBK7439147.1 hypothetical protein [Saprospiraceae bacterium]